MKELYGEGVANHTGPESCGGGGNVAAEALTGVGAGQVFSCENRGCSGCRRGHEARKATLGASLSRDASGPCAVEDPAHARKLLTQELGDPKSGLTMMAVRSAS